MATAAPLGQCKRYDNHLPVESLNMPWLFIVSKLSAVLVSSACGSTTIAPGSDGSAIQGCHSNVSWCGGPRLDHLALGRPEAGESRIGRLWF